MEDEQVVNQEVETEVVETQEVTPTLEEVEKKMETNLASLEEIQKLADEVLADQKEFFKERVGWELERNGLEAFANIINPKDNDELNLIVAQLNIIVADIKLANSYQPKSNATQDAYSVAQQKGDTKKMIGSKLANLFK